MANDWGLWVVGIALGTGLPIGYALWIVECSQPW